MHHQVPECLQHGKRELYLSYAEKLASTLERSIRLADVLRATQMSDHHIRNLCQESYTHASVCPTFREPTPLTFANQSYDFCDRLLLCPRVVIARLCKALCRPQYRRREDENAAVFPSRTHDTCRYDHVPTVLSRRRTQVSGVASKSRTKWPRNAVDSTVALRAQKRNCNALRLGKLHTSA